jgi:hypothetical protein
MLLDFFSEFLVTFFSLLHRSLCITPHILVLLQIGTNTTYAGLHYKLVLMASSDLKFLLTSACFLSHQFAPRPHLSARPVLHPAPTHDPYPVSGCGNSLVFYPKCYYQFKYLCKSK